MMITFQKKQFFPKLLLGVLLMCLVEAVEKIDPEKAKWMTFEYRPTEKLSYDNFLHAEKPEESRLQNLEHPEENLLLDTQVPKKNPSHEIVKRDASPKILDQESKKLPPSEPGVSEKLVSEEADKSATDRNRESLLLAAEKSSLLKSENLGDLNVDPTEEEVKEKSVLKAEKGVLQPHEKPLEISKNEKTHKEIDAKLEKAAIPTKKIRKLEFPLEWFKVSQKD